MYLAIDQSVIFIEISQRGVTFGMVIKHAITLAERETKLSFVRMDVCYN